MAHSRQDTTDEALMLEYQGGNSHAFEELLMRHHQAVHRYIFRFLGNQQVAEEATQEVFVKIIRAASRYEPRSKFTTWMYRIVHNYCIDMTRRQKLRHMVALDAPIHKENETLTRLDLVPSNEPEVDEQVVDKELHDRLQEALEKLNPDQREVFLMREKLGLHFHEIASILNVSTNTVKSRMRYALSALRKDLENTLQPKKQIAT